MKWLSYKHLCFLTTFIFCSLVLASQMHIVDAQDVKTGDTKPKLIITHPEQELVFEKRKKVNVVVKVLGKGDVPLEDVEVKAKVTKGKKLLDLSPARTKTNKDGKAVFTVTGSEATDEDLGEIKFTAEKLKTHLRVKIKESECKPASIKIKPERKLILEEGKSSEITVRLICQNESPAVDFKVDAFVQDGSGKIDLSSTAEITDESGRAVFTVTGIKATKKEPATIKFKAEELSVKLDVKVNREGEMGLGEAGDTKLKSIITHPEQELVFEKRKKVNVVVKVVGKGDVPLEGVEVKANVTKGKKSLDLSPASAKTNEDGKAVFTVTGSEATDEDLGEIKFTAEKLKTHLSVKIKESECKPASIKSKPERKLILEEGKSSEITVRLICQNESPAVDFKVDAFVQDGSGKIDLSSTAEITDESGRAVFTVTGIKATKKEPATIKFKAEELSVKLDIKVVPVEKETTKETEETAKDTESKKVQKTETATQETESKKTQVTPKKQKKKEHKSAKQEDKLEKKARKEHMKAERERMKRERKLEREARKEHMKAERERKKRKRELEKEERKHEKELAREERKQREEMERED